MFPMENLLHNEHARSDTLTLLEQLQIIPIYRFFFQHYIYLPCCFHVPFTPVFFLSSLATCSFFFVLK